MKWGLLRYQPLWCRWAPNLIIFAIGFLAINMATLDGSDGFDVVPAS